MYRISKSIKFCAAHQIVGHTTPDGLPGKCAQLHGHNYEIGITVQAPRPLSIGFVLDYYDLGQILKSFHDRWDHTNLNDDIGLVGLGNTTAENIAMSVYAVANDMLLSIPQERLVRGLTIYRTWCKETDGTEAEYYPGV